jgi:hypothetical protein
MNDFIEAIKKSIKDKNWYGALFMALTLPDICGKVEHPNLSSPKRYKDWFDKYMSTKYEHNGTTFLSGNDCYALRCAVLHEGSDDITKQRAQKILERFIFMTGGPHCTYMQNNYVNGQRMKTSLQLRVDIFCGDICDSAEKWLKDISRNNIVVSRVQDTIKIYDPGIIYGGIKFG